MTAPFRMADWETVHRILAQAETGPLSTHDVIVIRAGPRHFPSF
jgi:hypothetical protein